MHDDRRHVNRNRAGTHEHRSGMQHDRSRVHGHRDGSNRRCMLRQRNARSGEAEYTTER